MAQGVLDNGVNLVGRYCWKSGNDLIRPAGIGRHLFLAMTGNVARNRVCMDLSQERDNVCEGPGEILLDFRSGKI